jgi:hypothetical protein
MGCSYAYSEMSTVASMHVMAVAQNAAILEIGSGQKPVRKDLFYGGLVEFRDGYASLPDRPGLGLDLDEKVAAKFSYKPKDWRSHRFPDGTSVTADPPISSAARPSETESQSHLHRSGRRHSRDLTEESIVDLQDRGSQPNTVSRIEHVDTERQTIALIEFEILPD